MRSILCMLLFLVSFAAAAEGAFVRPATSEEQQAVIKHIQNKARDSDSVKVRDLQVAPDGKGNLLVCGEVNGKNGYGGFTGFQTFYGMIFPASEKHETLAYVLGIGSTDTKRHVIQQMCADAGISI